MTRLMKLLFLIRQETPIESEWSFYDFVPYKYGPYSFFANRDVGMLRKEGLAFGNYLEIPANKKDEAKSVFQELPSWARDELRQVVDNYRGVSTQSLVDEVYEKFPDYTILSERDGSKPKRKLSKPAVYTLGYEGSTIDSFLYALIKNGIARLIDVRNNPVSRKYGFSKKTLCQLCKNINVEYKHFPGLGIESQERTNLTDLSSYQDLFKQYAQGRLSRKVEQIDQVATLMQEKPSVLVCYEADVRYCHRNILSEKVAKKASLPTKHLNITNE